ncbi:MAG: hypothetical protein DME08_08660 [Candidatus Rokuibacteriota bacterium]|nr:MAG: hypothetical protein DME08_08660 [Candidatus Rokubacteria bacterium]
MIESRGDTTERCNPRAVAILELPGKSRRHRSRFDLIVHVLRTVIADRPEPAWDNPRDMIER